jgi:hypothetical protein
MNYYSVCLVLLNINLFFKHEQQYELNYLSVFQNITEDYKSILIIQRDYNINFVCILNTFPKSKFILIIKYIFKNILI